jgi:hypothetical protein
MLWPEAMAGVVRPSAFSNHPALGLRQRCPSLSQEGSFLHTLKSDTYGEALPFHPDSCWLRGGVRRDG